MESAQQLVGPLILLPLMFVVGLQLEVDDFRRVFQKPRAVVGGTLGQLLLLPLMTWGVVSLFDVSPVLAAGAVMLAATPGAGMSNVMTAIASANVALSVTLTACSSALAVVTLPALTALGISTFIGDALDVEVPVGTMVGQLVALLAIPISLGMFVRARRPEASVRYVSRANRVAMLAIVALTVLGAVSSEELIPDGSDFGRALVAGAVWALAAMTIGWGLGALLALNRDDRFTFLIEFGARNIAMTVVVAIGSLGRLDLAVFAVAYSLSGFPLVLALAALRARLAR